MGLVDYRVDIAMVPTDYEAACGNQPHGDKITVIHVIIIGQANA